VRYVCGIDVASVAVGTQFDVMISIADGKVAYAVAQYRQVAHDLR
jgi:hypothetical protein